MADRVIYVSPVGWKDGVYQPEKIFLSDMDHLLPRLYVLIAEVFELPDDADKVAVVENMHRGLEYALTQYPALAGGLHVDDEAGRLWVKTNTNDTVPLYVAHAEDKILSYAELNERHFPMAELDSSLVLPKLVTEKSLFSVLGENAEEKQPIAVFQINFIRGGLVLGVAIHHNCSDGPGVDSFLTAWAESAKAVATGQPFAPINSAFLDRTRLSTPTKPDAARSKKLEGRFPIWKDLKGPPPPPPADFKMPALASRMWHFPASKLAELKALASASRPETNGNIHCATANGNKSSRWISTFDALVAFVWQRVTLAKLPLLNPDLDSPSMLAHTVNTRMRMCPPLPDRFMGNAVTKARVQPMPIRAVIDPANLPLLAQLVRKATNEITPEALDELTEWISGLDDRRNIHINANSFLGMDFLANSWSHMNAYTAHDFGFGCPRALRWPNPPFEGYLMIFPSRAGIVGGDEGLEMAICLEEKTADRLMFDKVMLQFAYPRL